MFEYICKICDKKVEERKHFWTEHRIKEADFYQKYEPRVDLYDGSSIVFKNPEQYFQSDFNSRPNLREYLKKVSKQEGIDYLIGWLKRRKEIKGLIYGLDQFTTKSLLFPTISFIQKFYGKGVYEEICNKAGLKVKFDYSKLPEFTQKIDKIIIDTREISPYFLDYPLEIKKLDVADYCVIPNSQNVFFEKKTIEDWAGTVSAGFDRFRRELQRAKDKNAYIIVIIEAEYNQLLSINHLPHTKFIKAKADFLLYRCRDLYLEFDNFQMVACGNRTKTIEILKKLLKMDNIKDYDIQFLLDNSII